MAKMASRNVSPITHKLIILDAALSLQLVNCDSFL